MYLWYIIYFPTNLSALTIFQGGGDNSFAILTFLLKDNLHFYKIFFHALFQKFRKQLQAVMENPVAYRKCVYALQEASSRYVDILPESPESSLSWSAVYTAPVLSITFTTGLSISRT